MATPTQFDDLLIGTAGADLIDGLGGDDTILGEEGDDVLIGGGGNDTIFGSIGNDTIEGGDGNDLLIGGIGNDIVDGGSGNDVIRVNESDGIDVINGGDGIDSLILLRSTSTVNLTLSIANPAVLQALGDGTTVVGIEQLSNFTGGSGNDTVTGGNERDLLDGGAGNDVLSGGLGDDFIDGSAGTDQLNGGGGNDELFGGIGNDSLNGGDGFDTLVGGAGDDIIAGGAGIDHIKIDSVSGADSIDGGTDDDIINIDLVTLTSAVTVSLENPSQVHLLPTGTTFINVEYLIFRGGTGDDNVTGGALADTLDGYYGSDIINGAAGNDYINGGLGDDTLFGGSGDDQIFGDPGNDIIDGGTGDDYIEVTSNGGFDSVNGGAGIDTLNLGRNLDTAGVTISIANPLTLQTMEDGTNITGVEVLIFAGGTGNDFVIGGQYRDLLDGGGRDDVLEGGAGDDALIGGAGYDVLSYAGSLVGVTVNLELGTATGGDATGDFFQGFEDILGSAQNDTLTGDASGNFLWGENGNDRLSGGLGNDALYGGNGTDTAVFSGNFANYSASYNAANGSLLISGVLDGVDFVSGVEQFQFNDGLKTLDQVIAASTPARVVSISSVTASAPEGNSGVKQFTFSIALSGPSLLAESVNYSVAGSGANPAALNDFSGSLSGTVSFAAGETLKTITINVLGDTTVEADESFQVTLSSATPGISIGTAQASAVILNDDVLPINVINGTAANNTLIGTTGVDLIDGLAGNDNLSGLGGADTLIGGAGIDTANYATSAAGVTVSLMTGLGSGGDAAGDTLATIENLTGSGQNDTLEGNAANNVLAGGLGIDTVSYANALAGVTVNLALTAAQNTVGAGSDTLTGFENLTGSGLNDILTGNTGNNILRGLAGNDTLNGGVGVDMMFGGIGNDTYVVDNVGDVADETVGDGIDTVQSAIAFSLSDVVHAIGAIENLTLTGAAAISGTGNTFANIIIGNAGANTLSGLGGNDTLNGGAGADAMIGGTGDDTYVVDNAGDVADETGGDGSDTVQSSRTFSLSDAIHAKGLIENLTLTGVTAINATGNALANVITGNSSNNILSGLGGADTLIGGAGIDTANYATSAAGVTVSLMTGLGSGGDAAGDTLATIENLTGSGQNDTLEGNAANNVLAGGLGIDTVSYANALAGVTVNLALTAAQNTVGAGSDTLTGFENLTGSGLNDILTGNTGNNILRGLAGNDTLNGGAGLDTLEGGAGNDVLIGGASADEFNFSSLADGGDVITDFATGIDDINLAALLGTVGLGGLAYATLLAQGNLVVQTGNFATGTATNSAAILDTRVYVDTDGNGVGSSVLIATLEDTLTSSGDFLL